jgi:4a-hydroxytetrahydrobiopterin dehydratase
MTMAIIANMMQKYAHMLGKMNSGQWMSSHIVCIGALVSLVTLFRPVYKIQKAGILLTCQEITTCVDKCNGWKLTHNKSRISKQFKMKNFNAAIDFINRVARLSEQMFHHPDIHLVAYRSVELELYTQTVEGLTTLDFEMAKEIDKLPGPFSRNS